MKVLFFIVSGADAPSRFSAAMTLAARSAKANRYDDLKVQFFGSSIDYITKLTGDDADNFEYLLRNGNIDSACIFIAEKAGVKGKLEGMGVGLRPAGETLAGYVNKGYTVLVF